MVFFTVVREGEPGRPKADASPDGNVTTRKICILIIRLTKINRDLLKGKELRVQ